jgi:hypothetical protein
MTKDKYKWLRKNGFTKEDAQKIIGFHWESLTLLQIKRGMSNA